MRSRVTERVVGLIEQLQSQEGTNLKWAQREAELGGPL
jgi:hypothetical protein